MITEPARAAPAIDAELAELLRQSDGAILVGGQALAFWVAHWEIALSEWPREYISGDTDFLGFKRHVVGFARALNGIPGYPPQRAITALVGFVTRDTPQGSRVAVDVLAKIVGVDAEGVRKRAIAITDPQESNKHYFVMNPIDCLVSRIENYRQLRGKRNEVGAWHCRIAIRIARAYLKSLIGLGEESSAIAGASAILHWALGPAGLQIFAREGIDILDSIPIESYQTAAFKEEQHARMTQRVRAKRAARKPAKA